MATFTWAFDAPTGTYKSHAMSKKIYEAAVAKSVAMDHVRPVEGFGRKMGETVTISRIANITEPGSATLTEAERIPEDTFSLTTTSVTVVELGRAVPYTSLADDLSFFDLENPIQNKLRDQMRLTLDQKAFDAMTSGQVKWVPTGLASRNVTTNGTAGAQATANMTVWQLESIRDYLFDTLNAPGAEGDDYIGIFRTAGIRGIKRDPAFEEWHKYTDPSVKFNSEVGRMEQIRLIETNHGLGLIGASSILGEGVVFGSDFTVMAEVMTPEMRAAIPQDFGRSKAVAWYGILEFLQVWGDSGSAGQARAVHVTST